MHSKQNMQHVTLLYSLYNKDNLFSQTTSKWHFDGTLKMEKWYKNFSVYCTFEILLQNYSTEFIDLHTNSS